jgi:hypothetical protein
MTCAQTRGRTIERQADGLRQALVNLAANHEAAKEVRICINAIRYQLSLVESEWGIGENDDNE